MLTTPDRLLELPSVHTVFNSPECVILHKHLENSQDGRESYLRMHALSVVIRGEQIVREESGQGIRIAAGQVGILSRGIYTISDLIAEKGGFEALLVFFTQDELHRLISAAHARPLPQPSSGRLCWPLPGPAENWAQDVLNIGQAYQHSVGELFRLKISELITMLILEAPDRAGQLLHLGQPLRPNLHRFMELHFDKPFTIQDYAYLSGRSESTFRREFKQRFGVAPLSWIRQKRLEKAHHILLQTSQQVSEVSRQVGYDSVSHFIEAYKKQFGVTPGSMR